MVDVRQCVQSHYSFRASPLRTLVEAPKALVDLKVDCICTYSVHFLAASLCALLCNRTLGRLCYFLIAMLAVIPKLSP